MNEDGRRFVPSEWWLDRRTGKKVFAKIVRILLQTPGLVALAMDGVGVIRSSDVARVLYFEPGSLLTLKGRQKITCDSRIGM